MSDLAAGEPAGQDLLDGQASVLAGREVSQKAIWITP
jgi:hypothetical protein